jgi:hypothetical protein
LSDLDAEDKRQLEQHLLECPTCAAEQRLYADTLDQVKCVADVPVPRHFFVYPDDRHMGWLGFFRNLAPGWRLTSALAGLAVGVLIGLTLSRFQFQVDDGVYSFSFGRSLRPPKASREVSTQNVEILKKELMNLLEARSQRERMEWMNAMRQEFKSSNRNLTRKQERQWNAALSTLEARLNNRLEGSAVTLNAGMERSVGNLYQTLQRQRQQDLALTRERLDRIATRGALRDQETDEILATLLQVADLRLQK